ncbi:MAG: response regulator [Actinobacteria bacterium]|nr:response regulator [Actinomycetota bacterium]
MKRHRVLVADPNPAVRKLLSVIFDAGRYVLGFASDGEEALGLAIVESPHLVLTEVRLDGLDGISLCRQLKEHPRTSGTKVLVLTTSTSEWDMRRARRAGADGYLTKPFSPALLLHQVDALLDGGSIASAELEREGMDRQSCR